MRYGYFGKKRLGARFVNDDCIGLALKTKKKIMRTEQ